MLKFILALSVVFGLTMTSLAQQNSTFKVKHSTTEKTPKSAPVPKPSNAGAASARNLQNIERQTAKSASSHSTTRPATAPKVKAAPAKDKSNPPIHFEGAGKKSGMVNQSPNPYQGRLKQKGPQH